MPHDADVERLFERGVLANCRDFTDEVETILTKIGREQVKAAVVEALR